MSYGKIYKDILREYERSRDHKARLLDEKRKEIYAEIPKVREIDETIAKSGIGITRLLLTDNENAQLRVDELIDKTKQLKAERARLLLEAGYGADSLEPAYDCPLCMDTGYINTSRCACFTQKLIDRHYGLSNLRNMLDNENFDKFNMEYYSLEKDAKTGISPRVNMERIRKVCMDFVINFDDVYTNLLFYGDTGLGKTYMCNCIAKELLEAGKTVLYTTAPSLFKFYEDCRFNRDELEEPREYATMVATADLLIIDDLGTEFVTSCGVSELFNIINTRILDMKHTVVSTNLIPGAGFENIYSQRLVSRFVGNYVLLKFFGNDIRLSKKYA